MKFIQVKEASGPGDWDYYCHNPTCQVRTVMIRTKGWETIKIAKCPVCGEELLFQHRRRAE